MYAPVIHGAVTTLLAVVMLAFSEFEFIVRYFFLVLLCLIGIGLVNGLFFFPILLSLVGPSPEVIPHGHPNRISTPTPPASPIVRRTKPPAPPRRSHKIENARLHAEPSLTTITEEPNSWHSTQESCIIVQPELKVETTSTCGNQVCNIYIFFVTGDRSMFYPELFFVSFPSTMHDLTECVLFVLPLTELWRFGLERIQSNVPSAVDFSHHYEGHCNRKHKGRGSHSVNQ